jgi:hypothetical protein
LARGALALICALGLAACGGDDAPPAGTVGTGEGGVRDSGDGDAPRDAAMDGSEPSIDGDFGFEELALPDASDEADAGDASVPLDPPEEWSCDEARYADGAHCDCGCNTPDPDCADEAACTEGSCEAEGCDVRHDDDGNALRPDAYSCDAETFASLDGCDCGCGAIDPDCVGFGCTGEGCRDTGCTRCRDEEGALFSCDFSCDLDRLGDGTCDCGCGMLDPDCDDTGCAEPGCYADGCEKCEGTQGAFECERGACPAGFELDGACNCGCRERDPECLTSEACVEPGCSAPGCGRCFDVEGELLVCEDWLCDFEKQGGGDGCNCGCGAADSDCEVGQGCVGQGCMAEGCETCRDESGVAMSCMP